jgi:hypothetical protein
MRPACPLWLYGFKHLWTDPAQMAVSTGAIAEGLNVVVDERLP